MRAFKIWNKNRTSSFDLSGLNVITSDIAGLGNRFTNELYDGRIKKHLINQYNSFEQINLTVNFGVNSNAYQKYRDFMNFIQANGRNILVIEYYTPGASRFVDVVLSNTSKSQKTGFGVLVETVTFDRLTPYYIMYRRTGTSILVSNNYMENVMPKITMSGRTYQAGTKIRVKSKNEGMPDLTGKEYLGNGVYRLLSVSSGGTADYNVYNGNYILNGLFENISFIINNFGVSGIISGSYYYVSGEILSGSWQSDDHNITPFLHRNSNTYITNSSELNYQVVNHITLYINANSSFNNYQFKLQLEKAGNNIELDRPIDELNGYTLREVFDDGNLVKNGDFNNTLIGWSMSLWNSDYTDYTINGLQLRASVQFPEFHQNIVNDNSLSNNNLYYRFDFKIDEVGNGYVYLNDGISTTYFEPSNTNKNTYAGVFKPNTSSTRVRFGQSNLKVSDWLNQYIDNIYVLNRTSLGISSLTVEQMDYYFNQYQTLKTTPTEYSIPVTDTREIELNETILSNQELIIDSENKTVTLNGANAYQITNKDKSTFLNLPDGDYLIECDLPIEVEYKKWVID